MIILNLTAEAVEVREDDGFHEYRHAVVLSAADVELWRSAPTHLRYDDHDGTILEVVTDRLREVFAR